MNSKISPLKIIIRLIVLPFFAAIIFVGGFLSCLRIIYNFLCYGGTAHAFTKPQEP